MMSFSSPGWLVTLLVLPVLVVWYTARARARIGRSADLANDGLVATGPVSARWLRLPFALFVAGLTTLLIGLARPQTELTTARREGTAILAFDVSNSMRADDIQPTRLDAAKKAAAAFVERQPDDVRIGVVAFGDGASIVQRPTTSRADVVAALERLGTGGGTSLGQGLFTALSAIAGEPLVIDPAALESDTENIDIGYFGTSAVVLLSDGENTDRVDPNRVAELASTAGVRVHAVGVGTEAGDVVEVDGFRVATALDAASLRQIASVTDGSYYEAGDAQDLAKIYETIELRATSVTESTEITALFTAAGALFLCAAGALSILRTGRVV